MLKTVLKAELSVLVVAGIVGQKVAAKLWEAASRQEGRWVGKAGEGE